MSDIQQGSETPSQTDAANAANTQFFDRRPKPVIRLDRSKHFSECRGERTPSDPHYRVVYWQGRRVGKEVILLPFDVDGLLVPDDGKLKPWLGKNVEDKEVLYYPLYTDKMRELVDAMEKKLANPVHQTAAEAALEDDEDGAGLDPADEVNLEAWLRGEQRYMPQVLRAACKKRFSRQYQDIRQMVIDLVEDERIVPANLVCPELRKHLA